eukprot:7745075-Alexandrium_andersonii.AAC.1
MSKISRASILAANIGTSATSEFRSHPMTYGAGGETSSSSNRALTSARFFSLAELLTCAP